ncbi:hypothetical protein L210DRAFT_3650025 [Boletus edulis BED1]|uniref:DUF8190 domain-containing protein n=1 Tax=Boletus edulis BED1 TaxID=1328754 RepID=A0AAD4BKP4_BOLED|nr:hypothetical protein L210DRAFT_3650025 [Boletus edulis BED1]
MPFQHPRPRPRPRPRFPSLTPLPSDSDSDSIPQHSPPPSPHVHHPRPIRRPTTPPRPFSPHPHNDPNTDDDDDDDVPGPIDPLFANQHDHPLPHAPLPPPLHHPAPFNVALVPDHMLADDPYTQDVVEDAIMRSVQTRGVHQNLDFEQRFATTHAHSLSLTTLASLYRSARAQDAVRLLQYRSRLVIPNSLLLDQEDNDRVLAAMDGHFIDYSLCLGSRLGLDALLPSLAIAHDHTWHIQLSFSRLFKLWPNTPSKLPFSTTGRMLHIGTRQQEDIWLALVPNTVLEPPHHLDLDADPAPPGDQHHDADRHADLRLADDFTPLDAPTTALVPTHAYMIVLFFAHVLSTMRFDDIHLTNQYPEDLTKESVSRETDLLGRLEENRRVLELTLPQLRLLHAQLRDSWPAWVQRAPDSWKTDSFLINNSPVALTVRYGQNQPIYSASDDMLRAAIRQSWERDHDLTHVRSLSFSIAHHLIFKEVDQWTCLSGDILHRAHPGPLYDLPESDPDRVEVDLRRIRGGHDVPVYDTEGYRVRRRVPTRGRSTTSGALVDLTKVHDLFSPDEREDLQRKQDGHPSIEVTHLVDYLHEHCDERSDSASFKEVTYNTATAHIRPHFNGIGGIKTGKMVASKWSSLKVIYNAIESYRNQKSDLGWHNENGANIEGTFVCEWEHYDKIRNIFPTGGMARNATEASSTAVSHANETMAPLGAAATRLELAPLKFSSKCSFSNVSGNETSSVSLFVPPSTVPPTSTSGTSHRLPSKRSKVTTTTCDDKGPKVSPAIAFIGIQSSINRFSDTVQSNVLDPMVLTQRATKALFADVTMAPEHRRFMLGILGASNSNNAAVYTAIPDIELCQAYVKDLYDQQVVLAAAAVGSSSGVGDLPDDSMIV